MTIGHREHSHRAGTRASLSTRLSSSNGSSRTNESERPLLAEAHSLLEASLGRAFDQGTSLTLGLEEEVLLLQPESFEPASEIEHVLDLVGGDPCCKPELRAAQLELVTPPALTASDSCRELAAIRTFVVRQLAGEVRIAAVGTHPFWTGPICVTDRARYRGIVAEWPWTGRRGFPSGLHVHVGVACRDRALAVYNAARSYLPEIAAMAANSPFFEGADSRLASARLKLTEDLTRSGVPPAFASWRELADFLAWGARGGAIPDASYLWWDLRPNPKYGTLEFRIADAQTRVRSSGAIAAVCQTLVAALADAYDAGDELPVHETFRIAENRWRAVRDGVHGQLVDLDTGSPVPTRDRIEGLLASLEPYAEDLGCRTELLIAWDLLTGNGADEQRARATGLNHRELMRWLADETEKPIRHAPVQNPIGVPAGRLAASAAPL